MPGFELGTAKNHLQIALDMYIYPSGTTR